MVGYRVRPMSDESPRHFSLIREFHLADFFTIANGCCGVGAIFWAMKFVEFGNLRSLVVATALIPVALVCDVLDGRVARWRHKASPMGRELDSLADLISFGVAPATIAYSLGLKTTWDQIGLTFFVVCGLSRLARYNITAEDLAGTSDKVPYFEGTPIPTSLVPLLMCLALWQADYLGLVAIGGQSFHLATFLFVVSGGLMASRTIHIPKP